MKKIIILFCLLFALNLYAVIDPLNPPVQEWVDQRIETLQQQIIELSNLINYLESIGAPDIILQPLYDKLDELTVELNWLLNIGFLE